MKKLVLFALIAGSVCAPLIAQSGAKKPGLFSAGGGVVFPIGLGGGYTAKRSNYGEATSDPIYGDPYKQISSKPVLTFANVGLGGFAFFDVKYMYVSLGFSGGSSKIKRQGSGTSDGYYKGSYAAFDISVLGKYPVEFGKFTVFPLLGIDYQIVISQKNENGDDFKGFDGLAEASDLSALWFQAGAGADFNITEKLYLRGELLYGIRTHNKFEKDATDTLKNSKTVGASGLNVVAMYKDVKINLGHGPSVKLAVGYRL
jgi:hypothetical protein